MTNVVFVRHGETNQNKERKIQGRLDYPLNETGILQASNLALYFTKSDFKFDYIYSSPLSRAYDTALILAKALNINEVKIDESFTERCFGEYEGAEAIEENFIHIMDDTALGLEKKADLNNRIIQGLTNLEKSHCNQNILVVSHSHTIKSIVKLANDSIINIKERLDNCSLTSLSLNNSKIKINYFNKKII